MQPTKKPTATEWKVIGCLFTIAPFLLGVLLIFLGYNATEERHELGTRVANSGWWFIGISLLALALLKITQKYIRR